MNIKLKAVGHFGKKLKHGTYRVTVPFQDDMGSISPFNANHGVYEDILASIIWELNSMRRHDGLEEFDGIMDVKNFDEIEIELKD